MKILVPLHGFITWAGGLDLIRVIVNALAAVSDEQSCEVVFALPPAWAGQSEDVLRLRDMVGEFTRGARVLDCGGDARSVNRLAVDIGANMVFPTMLPIRGSHVRKVGYIYDFQHRDLPDNFGDSERARRDQEFATLAEASDAIFTTSRFVAHSVQRHLGVPERRILVLPYTPYVQPGWFAANPADAQARYGTGTRYAIICNHFWIHKDHASALRAFAAVVQRPEHADLHLVLTGATEDFRVPEHFAGLRELMRTLGIEARCHILGLIPKLDQIALLRAAAVLIQPTHYEGGPGGGSSYEAIGLGVPTLLSDIPVNLEARSDGVEYFRVGDADDLAAKLLQVLALPRRERSLDELLELSRQRLQHSGRTILDFLRRLALPRVG